MYSTTKCVLYSTTKCVLYSTTKCVLHIDLSNTIHCTTHFMHTNTQIGFLETFIVFSFSVILGFERVSASINKPLESPRTSEIIYFNSKY